MTEVYSEIFKDPKKTPDWLVEGATNLLPKKEETWIPKNYRPIVCLPTTFKILTSVITDRLYTHLDKEAIMTPEQRGGKKDCYGCRDQLMINNAFLENCKKRKKNLSTAWIDYKKAFDSVPHSWILKCLQMYKIHPVLITFIEESMSQWKTNMTLVHKGEVLETGPIRIKRGIFQGDSLSPLLFTMSLNPLSKELQKTGYGYQLDEQTKINHLFYVDDLKLYGTSDNELMGLINTMKNVSDDIKMEFGLDKFAKASFKRGKNVSAEGIPLNDNQVIQDLDQAETYKYLGMEEGEGVQHHKMKVKIMKEYKRRIKLVLKSELNARKKIATTNTLSVPVILYSYGVIDWKLHEMQDPDRMTRKQICMNWMLAMKTDVDRIYLPCQGGGRSLMNLEKEYRTKMIGLQTYMTNKDHVQIEAVLRHQNSKALHSVPKEAEKYQTEAGTTDDMTNEHGRKATWKAKQLKLKYKEDFKKMVRDKWKEKAMHGKFLNYLDKDHVDVELSFEWMKPTGPIGETEGLITAAQDQALNTRYYSKHIIKQGTTDRCRMCHTQPETEEHIISGCQTLAADQYLNRHNQVAAQLHLDICRHCGIKVEAECWYQHKPERVMENEKATILWDSPIITVRHVPCNKPDIVIWEKKSDRYQIIDVAIPSDYNIQKEATEMISKYVDLQIECQRLQNKKVEVIPVIIGTTGIVDKNIK